VVAVSFNKFNSYAHDRLSTFAAYRLQEGSR
jgi:hypothetical protein